MTALWFAVTPSCRVYDDSLLGHAAAAGSAGHFGGNTAAASAGRGFAGEFGADSGAAHSGYGGLEEMAGALESGGAETSGGTGGTLSTGGTLAGNSGSGGHGGGGAGGTGGALEMASGCAKLVVPLDETSDKAHFAISLASSMDLSGATISMRFYVQSGQGGTIFNYVQDAGTYHFLGVPQDKRQALSSASGWTSSSWNVGAEPDSDGTGIVKTSIKSIGVELNAQPSSAWSNPTVVFVDSISVSTPTLAFTFDTASSVTTSNTTGALRLNNNSADTTATGSAATWQATCPCSLRRLLDQTRPRARFSDGFRRPIVLRGRCARHTRLL